MISFAGKGSKLHAQHEAWLVQALGTSRGWDTSKTTSMGVYRGGLAAVVLYHDYNPEAETICMSAAASGQWLDSETLYKMHAYPFNELHSQAIILQVSENNERMLRIARAFGYKTYLIPRMRGRGEAEVLCVLYDDVWRDNKFTKRFLRQP